MTYRVIFDFGDIEVTVYHKSYEIEDEKIVEGAIDQVINRNFGFPGEPSIKTVEAVQEWEEE